VNSLQERSVLPFFGAGISNDPPSNLPLGGTLRSILIENLLKITKKYFFGHQTKDKLWQHAREILENVMLEKIFGGIYDVFGDEALSFWQVLDTNESNFNHKAIAHLTKNRMFTKIITLNFDILIEIALKNVKYKTFCPIDGYFFPKDIQIFQAEIIKPHGSLPQSGSEEPKFKHIIATIQKIGNAPSEKNENAIINLVEQNNMRNILFIGYSDNDIDIFPIFVKHSTIIRHVFWFKFVGIKNNEIRNWTSTSWKQKLPDRLLQWFNELGDRITIICGNPPDFFKHLLSHSDLHLFDSTLLSSNSVTRAKPKIQADFLLNNPDKTALALAHLLENSGERQLSIEIFHMIRKRQSFQYLPQLNAFLLSRLAWGYHAKGDLTSAFSLRKEAKEVLLESNYGKYDDAIFNVTIELGYDYWSFVKKAINPKKIASIYKIPWFFWLGLNCFKDVKQRSKLSKQVTWIIPFYYGDLWHYFARVSMLISRRIDIVTKMLLNKATFYYKIALKERNENKSLADFYNMRYLETQILLDKIRNYKEKINEVEDAEYTYKIIQNDIQIGYSEVILALLHFCKNEKETASKYLQKAKDQYSSPHSPHLKECAEQLEEKPTPYLSGLMEIVCYERLFRILSLWQSIKYLLKLLRQHKTT